MTTRFSFTRRIIRSSTPAAVAVAIMLSGCSPDSSISAPQPAPAPAPKALLGLDPLVTGLTGTLSGLTSGVPVVGGLVATVDNVVSGLLTSCKPLSQTTSSKYIGPYGGSLTIGDHQLIVPPGALSQYVLISGTRQGGSIAEVDFQPHGLRFAKPATLRLSYDNCTVPNGSVQRIVYVDDAKSILETPPSLDDQRNDAVSAVINHFSGYAVATRTSSAQ